MNRFWDEKDKVHGECGKKIHELENAVKLLQEETELHRRSVIEATKMINEGKKKIHELEKELNIERIHKQMMEVDAEIEKNKIPNKDKPRRCGCGEIHSANERCGNF